MNLYSKSSSIVKQFCIKKSTYEDDWENCSFEKMAKKCNAFLPVPKTLEKFQINF